jgi:hypothetical protein
LEQAPHAETSFQYFCVVALAAFGVGRDAAFAYGLCSRGGVRAATYHRRADGQWDASRPYGAAAPPSGATRLKST